MKVEVRFPRRLEDVLAPGGMNVNNQFDSLLSNCLTS